MTQIDMFSVMYPKFIIDKPIRLIELFAGIGAQAKALENIGAEFEHWRAIEVDKYPMASYNAVHGTKFEPQDICNVHAADLDIRDTDKYCYILTYSFPCQDLSISGNLKGMSKGSGTRSGLLWEVERILDECNGNLPQVLLMENVTQVIAERNIKDFQQWRAKLESLGYQNYVDCLNAKDFGIPQNRNRCFMVSILGNYSYTFPKGEELQLRLKDMLEDEVDEKYFLSDKMLDSILRGGGLKTSTKNLKSTSTSQDLSLLPCIRCTEQDAITMFPKSLSMAVNGCSLKKTARKASQWHGGGRSIYQQTSPKKRSSPKGNDSDSQDIDGCGGCCGIAPTIRTGGHGSIDRHTWDLVIVDEDKEDRKHIWL